MAYDLGIAEAELLLVWLPGNNEVSFRVQHGVYQILLPDISRYPCRVTFVIWHIWIYCLDICMDFKRLSLGQNSKGNHPHILVCSWEFTLNQQQSRMNVLNRWPTTTCIGFGLNSMQPKQQSQSLTKKELETKERDGFP